MPFQLCCFSGQVNLVLSLNLKFFPPHHRQLKCWNLILLYFCLNTLLELEKKKSLIVILVHASKGNYMPLLGNFSSTVCCCSLFWCICYICCSALLIWCMCNYLLCFRLDLFNKDWILLSSIHFRP